MRHIVLMLALCLVSLTGQAQSKGNIPQMLERAEKALYSSGATIVEFSTTMGDKSGKMGPTEKGMMYLQGDAFRLEMGTLTAVYQGGTLSYYDSSEATFTISRPSADELMLINPLYFLRSRAKGFAPQSLSVTSSQEVVRFTPQQKSNVKHVDATFNQGSGLPSQLIFLAKDGGRLIANIPQIKRRAAYPQSFFTLSADSYPGCEVVDLR